ncbi:hypothetical protein X777_12584 [Ooceraea biroi]|uniref:Uncharacterized protein n=1 Tax=Ooceraea biroi TaxID=2015173 RepID=A0A026VZV9_OOCBI|nr:hypothetical protein X777_12584 [Ooceraea biroi]
MTRIDLLPTGPVHVHSYVLMRENVLGLCHIEPHLHEYEWWIPENYLSHAERIISRMHWVVTTTVQKYQQLHMST